MSEPKENSMSDVFANFFFFLSERMAWHSVEWVFVRYLNDLSRKWNIVAMVRQWEEWSDASKLQPEFQSIEWMDEGMDILHVVWQNLCCKKSPCAVGEEALMNNFFNIKFAHLLFFFPAKTNETNVLF